MLAGLDDSNFEASFAAWDVPVLVEFSAAWCKPCVTLTATLEEIANERSSRLQIAVVDIEASPKLTQRFEVLSVPTLVLLIEDALVWKTSGAKDKRRLLEAIDPHLGF